MAVKNSIAPIALSSINSSTFTGSYQLLSAASGIAHACSLIRIVNSSNVGVTVSYDGTNDHDFVNTLDTLQLPAQSNSQPNTFIANLPQGTKVYVKAAAGTGLVYLAGYYQPQAN